MLNKTKNSWISLIAISFTYYAIYSIQFIKSLYYSALQYGLHLNNIQIGQIFSAWGILSMIAYICGSFFLQKIAPKHLMLGSLGIMSALCLILSLLPAYPILLIIFGFGGFLVNSTFYPAYLAMMQNIGGMYNQGKTYGIFYTFSSIFGCLFSLSGFRITSLYPAENVQLRYLLLFFALINGIGVLLILFLVPKVEKQSSGVNLFEKRTLAMIVKNKKLWLAVIIVFANYINFSNLNYTLPYLTNQFQISTKVINTISMLRVYLIILIAAPLAGSITDRLQSAVRVIRASFLLYIIGIICLVTFCRTSNIGTILCIIALCFFVSIGKSMSLVIVNELGIPPFLTAFALSIISFLSYSPDAFYYAGSGWLLDVFPKTGYIYLFVVSGIFAIIGYLACTRFHSWRSR